MKSKYEISWKLINLFHSKNQGIVQRDKKISVGEGSYIEFDAVIVCNVKIGRYYVIDANTAVTSDIQDYSVAAEVSARGLKQYNWRNRKMGKMYNVKRWII